MRGKGKDGAGALGWGRTGRCRPHGGINNLLNIKIRSIIPFFFFHTGNCTSREGCMMGRKVKGAILWVINP